MRNHGRLESAMWRDDADWRALPMDSQWLYGALISQADLSLAGVLHVSRRRWSKFSADCTSDRLEAALRVLVDRRFVVVDDDTEELLVRSFARRETQFSNAKRRGGLKSAAAMIQSPVIRDVLVSELARVNRNLDGDLISVNHRPTEGKPIDTRLTEKKPEVSVNRSPEPTPIQESDDSNVSRLPSEVPVVSSSVTSEKRRATRFDPKHITDDWRRYAIEHGFTSKARIDRILEDFGDYWSARSDGTKLDWFATWRSWVRREADKLPATQPAPYWRESS